MMLYWCVPWCCLPTRCCAAATVPLPLLLDAMARHDGWTSAPVQQQVLDFMDAPPLDVHPPPRRYRTMFLKRYADAVTAAGDALCDALAEAIVLLMAAPGAGGGAAGGAAGGAGGSPAALEGCATYWVGDRHTTVRLSRQRTTIAYALWEATFSMVEYFVAHPEVLAGKRVLELGTGTALGGLMVAQNVKMERLIVTDVGADVLANVAHNVELNAAQLLCGVDVQELDWFADAAAGGDPAVDVVIGSDLVYE